MIALAGGVAAAFALASRGTIPAALAWSAALAIACLGYGRLLERWWPRQPASTTIAAGMVVLLELSLALAYAHVLFPMVQLGLVAAGIGLCALPRRFERTSWPPVPPAAFAVAIACGAAVIAVAAALQDVPSGDGANHVFLVKRLWDTGSPGAVHHGAGLQLVGESYWSLAGDARDAGIFELGACVALAFALLAQLVAPTQPALFYVLAIALACWHACTDEWSGIALALAAYDALARALAARRPGAHALLFALGIATVRHEYVLVALPIAAVAIAARRDRFTPRMLATCGLAWVALVVPFEIALKVDAGHAIAYAVALLAVVPVAAGLLQVLRVPPRTAIHPFAIGALALSFGVALTAIRPAQHAPSALVMVWLVFALCLAALVDALPRLAALVVVTTLVAALVWVPNGDGERRAKLLARWQNAVVALERGHGLGDLGDGGLHALQARTPSGAAVGFWGRSAEQLDFRRNPIRDVSFPVESRHVRGWLMRPSRASLAGLSYVIVENTEPSELLDPAITDPWGSNARATAHVERQLELVEANGRAALFRIAR